LKLLASPMVRSIVAAVLMSTPGMGIKTWERGKSSMKFFDFSGDDAALVFEFFDLGRDARDDKFDGVGSGHGHGLLSERCEDSITSLAGSVRLWLRAQRSTFDRPAARRPSQPGSKGPTTAGDAKDGWANSRPSNMKQSTGPRSQRPKTPSQQKSGQSRSHQVV
jgi:hypothetical protein